MELPMFKDHPEPLRTGSLIASERVCEVCHQSRGFIYVGAFYCQTNFEVVCPWCIADGSAHEKYGAEFTDRLAELGPEAVEAIRRESGYGDDEWTQFYSSLDAKADPATAYLFRCLHCGKIGGYSDCK